MLNGAAARQPQPLGVVAAPAQVSDGARHAVDALGAARVAVAPPQTVVGRAAVVTLAQMPPGLMRRHHSRIVAKVRRTFGYGYSSFYYRFFVWRPALVEPCKRGFKRLDLLLHDKPVQTSALRLERGVCASN